MSQTASTMAIERFDYTGTAVPAQMQVRQEVKEDLKSVLWGVPVSNFIVTRMADRSGGKPSSIRL
jgi:hypothetical protein